MTKTTQDKSQLPPREKILQLRYEQTLLNVILDWQENMEERHAFMNIRACDRRKLRNAILSTFNVTERE